MIKKDKTVCPIKSTDHVLYDAFGNPISDSSKKHKFNISKYRNKLVTTISLLLAVLSIFLGYYFYYIPRGTPQLFLSPTLKEPNWTFNDLPETLHEHNVFSYEFEIPTEFCEMTNCDEELICHPFIFLVANSGDYEAKGVWFKMYFPSNIDMRVLGGQHCDSGYDETLDMNIAYFNDIDTNVDKHTLRLVPFILNLNLPLMNAEYKIKYFIGSKNSEVQQKELTMTTNARKLPMPYIYNQKGILYIMRGDLTNALRCFKQATMEMPNIAAFNYNYGRALFNNKQTSSAEHWLERAAAIDPKRTVILNNLGICYLCNSQYDKAIDCFKKAIALNPEDKELKAQIDTINQMLEYKKKGKHGKMQFKIKDGNVYFSGK